MAMCAVVTPRLLPSSTTLTLPPEKALDHPCLCAFIASPEHLRPHPRREVRAPRVEPEPLVSYPFSGECADNPAGYVTGYNFRHLDF